MILGMEIALLVMGLCALATGKLTLSKHRVVYGAAARCLGLVAVLPLPLSFCIGFVLGAGMAARGQNPSELATNWSLIALEGGIVVACLVIVFGVGLAVAETPQSRSRLRSLDDELFRRAHPERFGDPATATAYQGTIKLQTMALFENRQPVDVARPPEPRRSYLPSWGLFLMVSALLGILLMVVLQSTGHLPPAPALGERPPGDQNNAWGQHEAAYPPAQLPGLDPRLQQAGAKVYLSDLPEYAFKPGSPGWGFGKAGALGTPGFPNQRVRFLDQPTAQSLCLHPPDLGYTRVCYRVGRRADWLHVGVCISDHDRRTRATSTRFVVMGDGKVLWRSASVGGYGWAGWVKLDVRPVDVLELRVFNEERASTAHAVWLNPYLEVRR